MQNKMSPVKSILILILICVITVASLAVVYHFTSESDDTDPQSIIEKMMDDYVQVLPGSTEFYLLYRNEGYEKNTSGIVVESVKTNIGIAITVHSSNHYGSSPIRILVGVAENGFVAGLKVLRSSETPGLGSKIDSKDFLSQFIGGNWFDTDGDNGVHIDIITAATRSSKAFTSAVNIAIDEFARIQATDGGN